MAQHSFSIGEEVRLSPSIFDRAAVGGAYCVVRLLPAEGTDPQYRLRSLLDGHERVARECQLLV